jgi:hypothetical protein
VRRALDLIGETLVTLEATAKMTSPEGATAGKVVGVLRGLETYVSGQSELIIDYATARGTEEPISTANTESTVQWPLHRRMGANQQMRWSPRGAHLMLKVRTSVVNGTFNKNLAAAERWARRPSHKAASVGGSLRKSPHLLDGLADRCIAARVLVERSFTGRSSHVR